MGAFEAGLEAAAAFIERNELVHTCDGEETRRRSDGNRAGLGYATGIRAIFASSPASPSPEALPSQTSVEAGAIQQWQWAGCGHSAWFDGEPPFGTKADEVARRTVYLAKPASEPAHIFNKMIEASHD